MRRKTPDQTSPDAEAGSLEDPVVLPIDGTLDLHHFDPRELDDLLPDYLEACRERGLLDVRIVHGKGRGVLRRRVEAILARLPIVAGQKPGGAGAGDWGATLVRLRPRPG